MAHREELKKLLKKIAEQLNYKDPVIIINDLSSGGANYTSTLYTAIIREKNKEDLQLFAKVGAVGEKFREQISVNLFDTERFAYTKLFKIYAALEEEHGVPEEYRLPYVKLYGFDDTLYQETMVLENLLPQGFGPCDRFKSIDWEYASAAVAECAKLHALSFAFKKKDPEEYQQVLKLLKPAWDDMPVDDLLKQSMVPALKVIKPEHKAAFENFMNRGAKETFMKYYEARRVTAIIHGDYRGNNLLHRVRKDGKVDIKIVDLQTLQGGSPLTDLLYFIFTGSDEQFRARYFDRLVEHYYSQLSAAMRRLHLDPHENFSREDFDAELKEKLPFGLTLATFTLPVITVDTEHAPKVDESLEISNFSVEKTSALYCERLNGVVNDYVRWGVLK
uniref:CHK kinase-like domain-containing protein n=1 Tax=Heliothis virescens TaxID=7102 RepID=A0A2A4JTG5_HELVI